MIYLHTEDTSYRLPDKRKTKKWVEQLIVSEGFITGNINYIFVSDARILEINLEYLQHDYYTDIITFDYVENKTINGDVFISVDTVKTNSKTLKTNQINEFRRVISHGVLHLCGYKDKTENQKKEMRAKEDFYLQLFPK